MLPKPDAPSSGTRVPAQQRVVPGWAVGMDEATWVGWLELQARFGLTDTGLASAIRFFKVNDKYPPGHMFRDLTIYPAQVARAFAILAASGTGEPRDLETLTKDLGMLLVSGTRFPEEPPGDRHTVLSRELQENVVVLGVLDLLRRHEKERPVKDLLTALRRQR